MATMNIFVLLKVTSTPKTIKRESVVALQWQTQIGELATI
jgi:hypothetical protein